MRTSLALFQLAGLVLVLAGCGGSGNTPNTPMVRGLNAVPAYQATTLSDGATIIASPLPYATESGDTRNPYSNVSIGSQTVTFASAGQTFASASLTLANNQFVDLIASNNVAGSVIVLSDNATITQDAEIRLVNASNLGSVDFVLTLPGSSASAPMTVAAGSALPAQPAFPGFQYQVIGGGTYQLQVFPAGQEGSASPYLDETIDLPTGYRWTLVLANALNGNSQAVLVQVQDNQQLAPS